MAKAVGSCKIGASISVQSLRYVHVQMPFTFGRPCLRLIFKHGFRVAIVVRDFIVNVDHYSSKFIDRLTIPASCRGPAASAWNDHVSSHVKIVDISLMQEDVQRLPNKVLNVAHLSDVGVSETRQGVQIEIAPVNVFVFLVRRESEVLMQAYSCHFVELCIRVCKLLGVKHGCHD